MAPGIGQPGRRDGSGVAANLLGLVVYEDLFDREQEPTTL
jgi:hypothetical protein